jgi:hypothetical protein
LVKHLFNSQSLEIFQLILTVTKEHNVTFNVSQYLKRDKKKDFFDAIDNKPDCFLFCPAVIDILICLDFVGLGQRLREWMLYLLIIMSIVNGIQFRWIKSYQFDGK